MSLARLEKCTIYVGVAGWSIPARYQDEFPGAGSHLQRYAERLSAVEINSSFQRHHRAQTYARWAGSVPAHFRFSVKMPRALTHEGELTARADVLDRFVEEVRGLADKLAVLLVQLPPKLAFDRRAASQFFKAVQRRLDVPLVCEPRHPTWGSVQANDLLVGHRIARVAADPVPWPGAGEPGGWPGLVYFRWHGQPRKYYSDYGAACLAKLQAEVVAARAKQVWAIFDNTAHGHALGNALATARRR
ncbi:MAG: DUF72 domain-containing protein [Pseudomonadota bacterium]|nr:DUF72 domain-containing protein [Pseudomonadota bacterium]